MAENLSVGALGRDVARLHENLRSHGFRVPTAEVRRQFFGPGTREALFSYQQALGLACHGELDEPTAAELSKGLQPAVSLADPGVGPAQSAASTVGSGSGEDVAPRGGDVGPRLTALDTRPADDRRSIGERSAAPFPGIGTTPRRPLPWLRTLRALGSV